MGKVEKVVVLSVLFLIAVILVVSLTLDDPLDKEKVTIAGDPGTKTAAVPAAVTKDAPKPAPAQTTSTPATVAALPATDKPASVAPSALLSATVEPPAEKTPAIEARASIPVGSILKTVDGLTDSYLPEMKFYTWQAGDSLRAIATKYYGDATKITILRRSNEGRTDVQPGEKILVPVYDGDAPAASAVETASAAPASSAAPESAPAATKPTGGPRTHVVKEGESLWKIAKQELGSGARWKEIYEANRDVLATPDAVHSGLRLRIP
jgi:nucleoid-associated protein YgaU